METKEFIKKLKGHKFEFYDKKKSKGTVSIKLKAKILKDGDLIFGCDVYGKGKTLK